MDSKKIKVVRVGLTQEQHKQLEAYQAAIKLDGSSKPSKEEVIILALENGGFKWLEKRTTSLKAKAAKSLMK